MPLHSSPIQADLQQLHARFAGLDSGEVASYIPELAKADPAAFGIVIATVDGHVYVHMTAQDATALLPSVAISGAGWARSSCSPM